MIAEGLNGVPIDQFFIDIVVHDFDFLHFVGSTETIEEMEERHPGFDGRQMGHTADVHDFLNGAAG